jgi:DNA polymerase, archaea type
MLELITISLGTLRKLEFIGSYKGAEVLAPKKGLYNNIVVVDAKSLYPSVGINYNLSFDTINCDCCKDNPDAKLSKIIPEQFTKNCKFVNPNTDWICKLHTGAFPSRLTVFKAERLKQKELGNKAKQHALKILINGGYGVFGNKDYSFHDPRVAELVTAAGRYILSEMQHSANYDCGFEIIYGDTDSLFLNNTSDKSLKEFQEKFNEKYDIELEIKNRYDKLLLSSNKKHYIGYEKGVIETVGFEGEKSDRPEFFHKVYDQLINDIIKQETDPVPNLRKAFSDLDSKANPDLLKISKLLNKELEEYNPTTQIYNIAKALGSKKGDLIEYYSSNLKNTGKSWTLDPAEIDISHYKELLWNTIDEILEIAGYPIAELAKEFGIKAKKKHIIKQDNDIVHYKTDNIGGDEKKCQM